jgi:Polyketide cyclase / dehydrase and lipid transport
MLHVIVATLAFAANPSAPHEHQGVLSAYRGAPPALSLSSSELSTLDGGGVVLKQVKSETGGRGVAVMNIRATPATIWSKITNTAMYPRWVEHVSACANYRAEGSNFYTRFVLDVWGASVEYYIKHTYRPDQGYLTWTLDYSRNSDLDDSVGFWRVTPVTTDPPVTRLEYSADIRLKGWVPGVLQDMIAKKGLTDATSWVKKQAEGG